VDFKLFKLLPQNAFVSFVAKEVERNLVMFTHLMICL